MKLLQEEKSLRFMDRRKLAEMKRIEEEGTSVTLTHLFCPQTRVSLAACINTFTMCVGTFFRGGAGGHAWCHG